MTLFEAHASIGHRVVYQSVSGMELHGVIRYSCGRFTYVLFDRDMTPKAVASELLSTEQLEDA